MFDGGSILEVRGDFEDVRRKLERLRKNLQRATVRALNNSAFKVSAAVSAEIAAQIDRPVAFTQKSMVVASKATDNDWSALVRMKDIQARYLAPLLAGGSRVLKPAEQRFMGRPFVPGPGVQLNASGNVPKATLLALLKAVNAQGAQGRRRFKGNGVVLLESGVFARQGRRLVPMLLFAKSAPRYGKRIDFASIAQSTATPIVADEFDRAIASAVDDL